MLTAPRKHWSERVNTVLFLLVTIPIWIAVRALIFLAYVVVTAIGLTTLCPSGLPPGWC